MDNLHADRNKRYLVTTAYTRGDILKHGGGVSGNVMPSALNIFHLNH
jgi:hypothetical protein